ncbi:MAG: hypothetical protein IJ566_02825 [Cardiobacteriaceae bacterium]|nr:hypothetical protein [Cardiobacteriaceae bacterium]
MNTTVKFAILIAIIFFSNLTFSQNAEPVQPLDTKGEVLKKVNEANVDCLQNHFGDQSCSANKLREIYSEYKDKITEINQEDVKKCDEQDKNSCQRAAENLYALYYSSLNDENTAETDKKQLIEEARVLHEKACKLNTAASCAAIYTFHKKELLADSSQDEAEKFLHKACNLGHRQSCQLLGKDAPEENANRPANNAAAFKHSLIKHLDKK